MTKGKFIVFYGVNNLGKTTQVKLLVMTLKKRGIKAEYIKYPVYALKPDGRIINAYLRKGNPDKFSPFEIQLIYYINRLKYEPVLKNKLEKGINMIAEDYSGAGLAWGAATGLNRKFLEYFESSLKKADLNILFYGKRFRNAIEKTHKFENSESLVKKAQKEFLALGKKYGWEKINANLPVEEVRDIIQNKISKVIKL